MIGSTSLPFRVLVGLLYLFLLAPILVVVPLSFSNDNYLTFPPQSWGVRWYAEMLHHETLIQAFWISLGIASVVTVLSLLAIRWQAGEDGTGRLSLDFAGDGTILADVECINLDLRDVTRPHRAVSGKAPRHPD